MRAIWIKRLLRLSARLPLRLNHAIGALIGRRALHGDRTEIRTASTNLALCLPELSTDERQQLLQQHLIEMGKTFSESGLLWFGAPQQVQALVHEVHGEALLKAGLERSKGVILAIPHLGNWEIIGTYCSARYAMTSLYRPPRQAGLEDVIRNARQRFGAKLVPTNAKGVRALYQALHDNELVAILPDQDPRENGGQFAPFFGIQANTMTLLSRLAQKSGATVLCTWAERLPHGSGFALHFSPVPDAIYSDEMQTSVTALNQAVEAAIRQIPAQYQWGYKRFRTRPEGGAEFYD
jgi:KDO2-lipid IV(A) lauroyltransferase